MANGLLMVLSGPSGTGKGTVCRILAAQIPNLVISISMTTRPRRPEEKEGLNYFFVSEEKFKLLIEENAFLEWAKVYGHYYGTPRSYVQSNLAEGKNVLLEIDTQGARKIKSNFSEGIYIFLIPPSLTELKRRIVERGTELPEKVEERFTSASLEILEGINYNYIVLNDVPERAALNIKNIFEAEKCRVKRNEGVLEKLRRGELIKCL